LVPEDALTGSTTMRVIKSKSNPSDPCGSYTHGQAEDYTINVVDGGSSNDCTVTISTIVEPITRVLITDLSDEVVIENTSSESTSSDAHEDFTDIEGDVERGTFYLVALKGNTNGNFANFFTIFIDWNQNGILDDEGEVYTEFS